MWKRDWDAVADLFIRNTKDEFYRAADINIDTLISIDINARNILQECITEQSAKAY
ncbi:MAG: hypothetical protein ACYDG3_12105 [Bacillati bacterium]